MGKEFYFFLFFIVISIGVFGQEKEDVKANDYYEDYPGLLTTRFYTSRKYTSFTVADRVNSTFDPNSTLNLGIGATYNDFTLNLALGFGFLNPGRQDVQTTYLDLQAHMYPKDWIIDLFGQFYTGYRVEGFKFDLPGQQEGNFLAEDLRVRKIGANVQRLLNGENLSLKAAFQQSAWQKKSAGSFMGGFEMYGGRIIQTGEEMLVFPDASIISGQPFISYFQFGPNVGYAGTLVLFRHFFITGVGSINGNFGYSGFENNSDREVNWGFNYNYFLRGFVGYNSSKWSINANYVHNNIGLMDVGNTGLRIMTGNYRVNFIYRFMPGKKLKPYLRYIDPKGLLGI
ncbi:hypothetical protein A33Q_3816 [Indibacter alkaliphilus LW1]|jgi:hypothetical protein|uniref:DUF4421 domain-containing protein n=1 Tax=Indibacter alkaliphilus (strain CCUG 57479 / KCTC 22604 / LW1) TaxID=1189612 RepID=S2DMR5_INDAL|nr:DUF4421 domain-containing protein [Indibacter alkaliphilus]EOZ93226.1 hypothetical protein A33Q_3816 [Indibacter alkaliphilus LW1]